LNLSIFKLLGGGYSQRRAAFDLELNRKTVVRKFRFLGRYSLSNWPLVHRHHPLVEHVQFDDLETFEHTKLKPLSITLAVEHPTRRILGFAISSMPAKGHLALRSLKKYGPRPDERSEQRQKLFEEIKPLLSPKAILHSDKNPHYGPDVKKHFPGHEHRKVKGRRGCVTGQGELKRGGFDPLFSLNHTCAMFRANINRLFRRTWCTTKLKQYLEYHVALYAINHNLRLLNG